MWNGILISVLNRSKARRPAAFAERPAGLSLPNGVASGMLLRGALQAAQKSARGCIAAPAPAATSRHGQLQWRVCHHSRL
jgi:hypothetical protein